MKKFLIIFLFVGCLYSQDIPATRVRVDSLKAFKTTYGTLDSIHIKSRLNVTRPTEFDSLVRFFTNFAVPLGSSYDTTRLPYLDKANTFTARQTMTSEAVDTIVSSTNKYVNIQDTLIVNNSVRIGFGGVASSGAGNLSVGGSNNNEGDYSILSGSGSRNKQQYSLIAGAFDTSYTTHGSFGSYIFGYNNTIGRTNPSGSYGNWLFGNYLRSENLGLWALGADDEFLKKIIPFEGSIVFVNEDFTHWLSNPLGLYEGHSFGWQSPRVADSVRFEFYYSKRGSATDALAWGSFELNARRGFTVVDNATTQKISGGNYVRHFSINENDDNAFHFNSYNTSGRPFGNVYVDSAYFIVSQGYAQADSVLSGGVVVGAGTTAGIIIDGGDYTSRSGTNQIGENGGNMVYSGRASHQIIMDNDANGTGEFGIFADGSTSNPMFKVYESGEASVKLKAWNLNGNALSMERYGSTTDIVTIDTNGTIKALNSVSSNGGFGVPLVVDTIDYTVSSSIGATTIAGNAVGWFRVNYSLKTTVADAGAVTVQFFVTSNDGGAITDASALVALTATTNRDRGTFLIFNSSGNIQFYTTVTTGGTSAYNLRAWIERVL